MQNIQYYTIQRSVIQVRNLVISITLLQSLFSVNRSCTLATNPGLQYEPFLIIITISSYTHCSATQSVTYTTVCLSVVLYTLLLGWMTEFVNKDT